MPPFKHGLVSQVDPGTQRHWYGGVLPGESRQIAFVGHGFKSHALGGAIVVVTAKLKNKCIFKKIDTKYNKKKSLINYLTWAAINTAKSWKTSTHRITHA